MRNELLRFLGEHIDELTEEDMYELREFISELVEERKVANKAEASHQGREAVRGPLDSVQGPEGVQLPVSHYWVSQDGKVTMNLNLGNLAPTFDLSKYMTKVTWSDT